MAGRNLTPNRTKSAGEDAQALSNPIRFRCRIPGANKTCITADIVEATPCAVDGKPASQVLREAGLLRGEIEGPATCYCLDRDNFRC